MAAAKLRDFAEALTNWYIRRSRDRFWVGVTDDPTSREAFDTLYTVLETLTRVAAPLIPLVSRAGLAGAHRRPQRAPAGLAGRRRVPRRGRHPLRDGRRARGVVASPTPCARSEGKRVRLPLPRLTVVVPDAAALAQFEDILRDELNVKSVELVELEGRHRGARTASRTDSRSTPAPRVRASASRCSRRSRPHARGTGPRPTASSPPAAIALEPGEYELVLETTGRPEGEALAVLPSGGFVLLDTTTHARARGRGPGARCHPRRAGHAQGGRLRRERPHPARADASTTREDARRRRLGVRASPTSRARRSRPSTS